MYLQPFDKIDFHFFILRSLMLDLSRIVFLWVNITNSLRDDGIIQRWGGQWVIGGEEKDVVESGRKASE